jgi:HSP20 family protein
MFRQPYSWREADRLRREMDRLFENSFPRVQRHRAPGFPAINVWTNDEEGIMVTAELPGFVPEDVDIAVTADTLTLSGRRQPKEMPPTARYHRRERSYGEFSRTFQLPFSVNRDQVKATIEKGVLQIVLPRADAEKPRQIKVRSA